MNNEPIVAGYYWARVDGGEEINAIVRVRGAAPFLSREVVDLFGDYDRKQWTQIIELGPRIIPPLASTPTPPTRF